MGLPLFFAYRIVTMRLSRQQLAALLAAIGASVNVVTFSAAAAAIAALQCIPWDGRSARRLPRIGHSIRIS